jgi:hypothetical protein
MWSKRVEITQSKLVEAIMVVEAELRQRIVDRARAETRKGINANKSDQDGNRVGWQNLVKYYTEAAHAGPSLLAQVKKYTGPVSNKTTGHWCGIFALWSLQAARPDLAVGSWHFGGNIFSGGTCVKALDIGVRPQPGDVGITDTRDAQGNLTGHHVIVAEVIPGTGASFSVKTIEGNYQPHGSHDSIVAEPTNSRPSGDILRWGTIFPSEGIANVRAKLRGRWDVKVDWRPWVYQFSSDLSNTVTYDDPVVALARAGKGNWSIQGHKVRIDWDVGSWDEWALPLVTNDQAGVWHSKEGRIGTIKATKKK